MHDEPDLRGDDSTECVHCGADAFRSDPGAEYRCAGCHRTFRKELPFPAGLENQPAPPIVEGAVNKALRQAHDSLSTVARLLVTSHGERSARVYGAQLDQALTAVDTLLELRAGDAARSAGTPDR